MRQVKRMPSFVSWILSNLPSGLLEHLIIRFGWYEKIGTYHIFTKYGWIYKDDFEMDRMWFDDEYMEDVMKEREEYYAS